MIPNQTLYLFRHGETYFSKNGLPYGTNEKTATILPEAKVITKKLAIFLDKQNIKQGYRSEFLRCEETALIIEENSKIHFIPEPLLNEFTEQDFDLFYTRMEKLVSKIRDSRSLNIAFCTHGAVIAALQKMLLNTSFTAHDLMYYPKPGIVLKIEGKRIEEVNFN